ncbi:hypothetical protein [Lacticaseibacillus mingshuiensis]|uniref:hypothetical protein n=1 Tax=Lacticaseibacillus mingshuiensis TaxID=2799574 RepID=UPI0019421090|nr:hypothetical protein [Lacticaseibacillus mingshuiensis]
MALKNLKTGIYLKTNKELIAFLQLLPADAKLIKYSSGNDLIIDDEGIQVNSDFWNNVYYDPESNELTISI